jgi:hypothetical protein
MKPRILLPLSLLPVFAAALFLAPAPAGACAVAPHANQSVQIADESAIIVWDEASKTEHFIRRASFQTDARDFGFLVPTPTQPYLAESDDEAFKTLAKVTEPEIVKQPRPAPSGSGCGLGCGAPPMAGNAAKSEAEPSVRVLDEQRVGGFKAVVLEADDAKALSDWLKDHEYELSPSLTEWADHYIKMKWKITAFKIDREGASKDVGTKAVRMTFKTDRPFFPYREPQVKQPEKNAALSVIGNRAVFMAPPPEAIARSKAKPPTVQSEPQRLLRVFFIGTDKAAGTIGDKGKWPGQTAWSNKVNAEDREKVLKQLNLAGENVPESWFLTEFEDHSSPRPGTDDVYFSKAEDQQPVKRPAIIQYVSIGIPDMALTCALAMYVAAPRLLRSRWRRLIKRFTRGDTR